MAKSHRPRKYINNKKNKTKPEEEEKKISTECSTCKGSFEDMTMMEFTHHGINCRKQAMRVAKEIEKAAKETRENITAKKPEGKKTEKKK